MENNGLPEFIKSTVAFDSIKKNMIALIEANLPLEFTKSEADGFYSVKVDTKGVVTGEGYAEGISKRLEDLRFDDLAILLTVKFEPYGR